MVTVTSEGDKSVFELDGGLKLEVDYSSGRIIGHLRGATFHDEEAGRDLTGDWLCFPVKDYEVGG